MEVISKAEVVNFTGETRLSPTELKSRARMESKSRISGIGVRRETSPENPEPYNEEIMLLQKGTFCTVLYKSPIRVKTPSFQPSLLVFGGSIRACLYEIPPSQPNTIHIVHTYNTSSTSPQIPGFTYAPMYLSSPSQS